MQGFILNRKIEEVHFIIKDFGYWHNKRKNETINNVVFKHYFKSCKHGRMHIALQSMDGRTIITIHYDKMIGNNGAHKSRYRHPYIDEEEKRLRTHLEGLKSIVSLTPSAD